MDDDDGLGLLFSVYVWAGGLLSLAFWVLTIAGWLL